MRLSSAQLHYSRRNRKRERTMIASVQVVGVDAADASPSILITVDHKRILFNCGEGTQRLCHEQKARLNRISHLFLTRTSWMTCGGLPGMLMTMADASASNIEIHGPANISHFLYATRFYFFRQTMGVNVVEHTSSVANDSGNISCSNAMTDDHMTVSAVVLAPELERGQKRTVACSNNDDTTMFKRIMLRHMSAKNSPRSSSPAITGSTAELEIKGFETERGHFHKRHPNVPQPTQHNVAPAVSYIVQLADQPGSLDAAKAKELGVPNGPLLAALKRGESVTLSDGRVVTSQECVAPPTAGPVIVVMDCPTTEHANVLDTIDWSRATGGSGHADVVVHMTPFEILMTPTYISWLKRISTEKTQHLVLTYPHNVESLLAYHCAFAIQSRLSAVHPQMFPVPIHGDPTSVAWERLVQAGFPKNCRMALPRCTYNLLPWKKAGYTEPIRDKVPDVTQSIDDAHSVLMTMDNYGSWRQDLESSTECVKEQRSGAAVLLGPDLSHQGQVVFLGTGSALPSKYRNVSGILLQAHKGVNFLLDAGEGTLGQLARLVGRQGISSLLSDIRLVYISHMHADHHLGLVHILTSRPSTAPPLFVVGPPSLLLWLSEYSAIEKINFVFVDATTLRRDWATSLDTSLPTSPAALSAALKEWNMDFHCVPVDHCAHATGCIVNHHSNTWKLVYSGDTRPCASLEDAGQDADVLIHEATFEDELAEEADEKRHSTTLQAVESGVKMRARLIVLTHFSQRYPKIPKIHPMFSSKTAIAFDYMVLDIGKHIPLAPLLLEPIKAVFASEHAALFDDN